MRLLALSAFVTVSILFLLLPSASYASHVGSQSFQKPDFSDNETTQADIEMENALLSKPKLLPDSPFYFIKRIKERIQLVLTFNKQKKSDLMVKMAKERLAEAKTLTEKGKAKEAEKAIGSYKSEVNKINIAEIEAQKRHLDYAAGSILESAIEKAPEEARAGLRIALNRTGNRTYRPEREDEPEDEAEREAGRQNESSPATRNETEDEEDDDGGYLQKNETQTGRNQTQEREDEPENETGQPESDYGTNETQPTNSSRNSTENYRREYDRDENDDNDGDNDRRDKTEDGDDDRDEKD